MASGHWRCSAEVVWTAEACGAVLYWAEKNGIALRASFRCRDLVPIRHPLYVGHAGVGMAPSLAGMIVANGAGNDTAWVHRY